MTLLVLGAILGGLLVANVATRSERHRRARRDLTGAKVILKGARQAFWTTLGELVKAAAVPIGVLAVAYVLFRIGKG